MKHNCMVITSLFGLMISTWANAVPLTPPAPGMRFIETAPGVASWATQNEMKTISEHAHKEGKCGGYIDLTEHHDHYLSVSKEKPFELVEFLRKTDPKPRFQSLVKEMLSRIDRQRISKTVEKLSSYRNRFYQSKTGVESAEWIAKQYQEIATQNDRKDVQVELYKHRFKQPSVIARIPGKGPKRSEVVVIGGHLDSIITYSYSPSMHAPGADDNASGTATVMEVFRVLVESGFVPSRTLEFMGYAGEEVGLLGSQDIAISYRKKRKNVVGAMQFDMTGFDGSGDRMTLITDYVHPKLTDFAETLIKTYVKVPVIRDRCNYACSDHASWTKNGYPSVFPFESRFNDHNKKIHTRSDLIQRLNFNHIENYAKLGLAFAVEFSKTP